MICCDLRSVNVICETERKQILNKSLIFFLPEDYNCTIYCFTIYYYNKPFNFYLTFYDLLYIWAFSFKHKLWGGEYLNKSSKHLLRFTVGRLSCHIQDWKKHDLFCTWLCPPYSDMFAVFQCFSHFSTEIDRNEKMRLNSSHITYYFWSKYWLCESYNTLFSFIIYCIQICIICIWILIKNVPPLSGATVCLPSERGFKGHLQPVANSFLTYLFSGQR